MIDINPYFSLEEKIDFLKRVGYEVKLRKIKMYYPVYHNDVDEEIVEVYTVIKSGKEYCRPCSSFRRDEWVDRVFKDEINKQLKRLLLAA